MGHLSKFCLNYPPAADFPSLYAAIAPCISGLVEQKAEGELEDEKEKEKRSNAPILGLKEDLRAAALDVLARSWPTSADLFVS